MYFYFGAIFSAAFDDSKIEAISLTDMAQPTVKPRIMRSDQFLKEDAESSYYSAKKEAAPNDKQTKLIEQLSVTPYISNHGDLDSNYMLRSILDCLLNSKYFYNDIARLYRSEGSDRRKPKFFNLFSSKKVDSQKQWFCRVLLYAHSVPVDWLSKYYDYFQTSILFKAPSPCDPIHFFFQGLLISLEGNEKSSNSELSFKSTAKSAISLCSNCKTFYKMKEKITARL